MELTPSEEKMILESRQKQKYFLKRKASALHLLKTAYEYETWLQEHGRGSSFTTFLDEFGYDENLECITTKYRKIVKLVCVS